jgi:hypothetical protein
MDSWAVCTGMIYAFYLYIMETAKGYFCCNRRYWTLAERNGQLRVDRDCLAYDIKLLDDENCRLRDRISILSEENRRLRSATVRPPGPENREARELDDAVSC